MFARKPIPLGNDLTTDEPLALSAHWLETHLHVIGPTGTGKSRLLFHLFQRLSRDPRATTVVLDPKGSLYRMCRDWAILHGHTKRLVLFDPSDPDMVIGYNNLRPNGLSWATHAKAAREAILAARAQSSLDETPQLARFLFLVLAASRLLELTLIEAVALLRPGSPVRKAVLPQLKDKDRFVYESLAYFDSLTPRRQEEVAASTLARLEAWVYDPTIRRILTQQHHSLDLAQVLANHQILLANFEQYRPLRPDDVRQIGRLLTNDVLAHVFERPPTERSPVYLLLDEVQDFATRDLCVALEKGRELGLHCILAHQHCSQLMEEEKSGYLFDAVMNNARTKIVFGGSAVKDLEEFLVKDLLLDQYDPWAIKDELTSLELDPIETTRVSPTRSHSTSGGRAIGFSESISEGESESETYGESWGASAGAQENRGTSKTRGRAQTSADGTADTVMDGTSHTDMQSTSHLTGSGETHGGMDALGSGSTLADGTGTTFTYDNPYGGLAVIPNAMTTSRHQMSGNSANAVHADSSSESTFEADGVSSGVADTHSHAEARTLSHSEADTISESDGETAAHGINVGRSHEHSESSTRGSNHTVTRGTTRSVSVEETRGESETVQPFYEYHKRHVVSSRTFLTQEEFLTLSLQQIKAQPTGHFIVKVPNHPAVFARAPFVAVPRIPARLLEQARQRIYALQPYYARVEEIEAEEQERTKRLALPEGKRKRARKATLDDPALWGPPVDGKD